MKLTHFEIYGRAPARLADFYSAIFGWQISKVDGIAYWQIDGGGGILAPPSGEFKSWVNYLEVDSLDQTLEAILKLGGKIIRPKSALPRIAWHAVVADPENNLFAVWQADKNAFPPPEPE